MANLTCLECGHSFELPDSKIPSARFNVKCPACRKVFQASVEGIPSTRGTVWDEVRPEIENLIKMQLESVRKEMMGAASPLREAPPRSDSVGKRALVCESDQAIAQQILKVLQLLGYSVQICSTVSEALTRLESGFYDVITSDTSFADDSEGGQKIIVKVNARKQDERRRMFLAVVSQSMKTLGPQSAFFYGANIFIQKSDLQNLENLLQEGMRYYSGVYGNYFEILEESAERL